MPKIELEKCSINPGLASKKCALCAELRPFYCSIRISVPMSYLIWRTSTSGGPPIRFVFNWFSEDLQFGFDCKRVRLCTIRRMKEREKLHLFSFLPLIFHASNYSQLFVQGRAIRSRPLGYGAVARKSAKVGQGYKVARVPEKSAEISLKGRPTKS